MPGAALRYTRSVPPAPDILEQLRALGYGVGTEEQAVAAHGSPREQALELLYGPPRIRV